MKRNEFKLLMEDWKKNFAVEGEVVSSTLNEGYTELDRAILEEGIKDMPIVKTAIGLFGAAAIFALVNMPDGLKTIKQMVDSYGQPPSITSQYDPAKQEFFRLNDSYKNDFDQNNRAQNLVAQMEEDSKILEIDEEGKKTKKELKDFEKTKWFIENASEYVEELAELCTVKDLVAIDDEDKKNYLQDVDLDQIDRDQAYLQATFYLADKFVSKSGYNRAVEQFLKKNKKNKKEIK